MTVTMKLDELSSLIETFSKNSKKRVEESEEAKKKRNASFIFPFVNVTLPLCKVKTLYSKALLEVQENGFSDELKFSYRDGILVGKQYHRYENDFFLTMMHFDAKSNRLTVLF